MKCKLYDALRDQLFHDISDIHNINIDISQDWFIRIMCATDMIVFVLWSILLTLLLTFVQEALKVHNQV